MCIHIYIQVCMRVCMCGCGGIFICVCISVCMLINMWLHLVGRLYWDLYSYAVYHLPLDVAVMLFILFSMLPIYHWYITMTSQWARWHLKSPALGLFTQPFIQAQIEENIKAPRHWPLWREFTGDRWIPTQKASNAGNVSISWCHHVDRVICLTHMLHSVGEYPRRIPRLRL